MTVSSWIHIVGDVWFVGSHPAWASASAADPLVIQIEGNHYPDNDIINEYFTEEYSMWSEDSDQALFKLPVAPDRLHKDNTSGGGPYGVILPDSCADGLLVLDTLTVSFVDYLRWVFASGGFPANTGDYPAQWQVRQRLEADLLRI